MNTARRNGPGLKRRRYSRVAPVPEALHRAIEPRAIHAFHIPLVYFSFYALCVMINAQLLPGARVSVSAATMAILFAYLTVASAWMGNSKGPVAQEATTLSNPRLLAIIFTLVPCIACILILLRWALLVFRYGSLTRIFANAFSVRMASIGHDTSTGEAISGYFVCLLFGVIPLAVVKWIEQSNKRYLAILFCCASLVFLNDLAAFARMGSLWVLLTFISSGLLFRIEQRISPRRLAIFAFVLIMVASTPRIFRHGGLRAMVSHDSGGAEFGIMPIYRSTVSGAVLTFNEYAAGLSAFSYYLQRDNQLWWGQRTFTPLWRFGDRLGIIDSSVYITTIDEPADEILPAYNIYTVLRDFHQDFGICGIAVAGIAFGFIYARAFLLTDIFGKSISIYLTTWLLYTPFYNAFSFGAFLIPLCLLWALSWYHRFKHNWIVQEALKSHG